MSFPATLREQQYSLLSGKESSESSNDNLQVYSDAEPTIHSRRVSFDWTRYLRYTAIVITVLAIYTAILFAVCRNLLPKIGSSRARKQDLLYTPMQDAFEFQAREVNYNFENINPFKGKPLEEIEESWANLINHPHDLIISGSDLQKMNRTSIPLAFEPDSYLVQPIAYHMLHCLYAIYKYAHPDFYGIDPLGPDWIATHTDHCVDNLRQFVQCHAGSGLSTFKWLHSRKLPWPVLNTDEVCVDWDHWDGWVRERSLSIREMQTMQTDQGMPLIVHPERGPVTAEDYGIKRFEDEGKNRNDADEDAGAGPE